MKRSLFIGTIILLLDLWFYSYSNTILSLPMITGTSAGVFIFFAALLSGGTKVDTDMRLPYHVQETEHALNMRIQRILFLLVMALPSLLVCILSLSWNYFR